MSFDSNQEEELMSWVRRHLPEENIINVSSDFKSGVILIKLLCQLSNQELPKIQNTTLRGRIMNVEKAMQLASDMYGGIEGINVSCIANGNREQILAFLQYIKRQRKYSKEREKQKKMKEKKALDKFNNKTKEMNACTNFTFEDKEDDGAIKKRTFSVNGNKIKEISTKETEIETEEMLEYRKRRNTIISPLSLNSDKDRQKVIVPRLDKESLKIARNSSDETKKMFPRCEVKTPSNRTVKKNVILSIINKKEAIKPVETNNNEIVTDNKQSDETIENKVNEDKEVSDTSLNDNERTISLNESIQEQPQQNDDKSNEDQPHINTESDEQEVKSEDTDTEEIESKTCGEEQEVITDDKETEKEDKTLSDSLFKVECLDSKIPATTSVTPVSNHLRDSTTFPTLPPFVKSEGNEYDEQSFTDMSNSEVEETFLDFGDDEEMPEMYHRRRETKDNVNAPLPLMNIKEIAKGVFQHGETYYEVKDVVNGENVLKPIVIVKSSLIPNVQALMRCVIHKTYYNEHFMTKEQKLQRVIDKYQSNEDSQRRIIKLQGLIRGYLLRNSKLFKRIETLKRAVIEIVESEKSYNNDLNIIKQMLNETIKKFGNEDIIERSNVVFDTIIGCNAMLYNNLCEIVKQDRYGRNIANAFVEFTKYLNYYSTYMNVYPLLKTYYEKLSESSSKQKLLDEISEKLLNFTEPDNYLIRLIQRPPRYKLLLGNVKDHLPPWWKEEDKSLAICISKMRDSIFYLNSCMKKNKDGKDVDDLVKKLVFPRHFLFPMDTPRRIVQIGYLKRVYSSSDKQDVLCVLMNDYMLVIKTKKVVGTETISIIENLPNKTKVNYVFDLRELRVEECLTYKNSIEIVIPNKHYIFECIDLNEQLLWINAIDGIFSMQQHQILNRLQKIDRGNKEIDKTRLNTTELLINPEIEQTLFLYDELNNEWNETFLMLHGNILCFFVNPLQAAKLQQPELVFDILDLKFRSLPMSQQKYSFEINYKKSNYQFACSCNKDKFTWLYLLRSCFYKCCGKYIQLQDFNVNPFNTDTLMTYTSFDSIEPVPDNETYNLLKFLLVQPENQICCDCYSKSTSHVDLDYGVFICDACAHTHRHCKHKKKISVITFEQCLTLPIGSLSKLSEFGNERGTSYYESEAMKLMTKPTKQELRTQDSLRKKWIKSKYKKPTSLLDAF